MLVAAVQLGGGADPMAGLRRLAVLLAPPEPGTLTRTVAPAPSPLRPATPPYGPPDRFERHEAAPFAGRTGHAWSPPASAAPPPAVVLLHGPNRDGRAMLDMWEAVAAREGLGLIAPDSADPAGWSMRADGPRWLDHVLAEAMAAHPFDPDRVYLYGHSAGAVLALDLAASDEGGWRAVAVHAGAPDGIDAASLAALPNRIQLGDADHLFPLPAVRRAARALAAGGHDVDLVVIPGHDHRFYGIGPRLAADAWAFFEAR